MQCLFFSWLFKTVSIDIFYSWSDNLCLWCLSIACWLKLVKLSYWGCICNIFSEHQINKHTRKAEGGNGRLSFLPIIFSSYFSSLFLPFLVCYLKQAGADLCQAQLKPRLAKPALPSQPATIGFSGQAWLVWITNWFVAALARANSAFYNVRSWITYLTWEGFISFL